MLQQEQNIDTRSLARVRSKDLQCVQVLGQEPPTNIAMAMGGKHAYWLMDAGFVLASSTVHKEDRSAVIEFLSGMRTGTCYVLCQQRSRIDTQGEQLVDMMLFASGQSNTRKGANLVQATVVLV